MASLLVSQQNTEANQYLIIELTTACYKNRADVLNGNMNPYRILNDTYIGKAGTIQNLTFDNKKIYIYTKNRGKKNIPNFTSQQ